jgi:phosphoglycolate phosphatase
VKLLFDLDGTLCDPREGIFHGFRHAMDVLGLAPPDAAAMQASIGWPLTDCFRSFGLDAAQAAEGAHHFQAFFEGRGFAEGQLYPGVIAVLRGLHEQGHGLAIVSAKPTFAVRFVAEALQLLPYFDGLFGCKAGDLAPIKTPILAEALQALGWDPADCLFIGDRAQDRDAAAAHGVPFVAAAWGFGQASEHSGAVAVLADIGALPAWVARWDQAVAPRP